MFSGFPSSFYVVVYLIFCCGTLGWMGEDDKSVIRDLLSGS